jgi:hypothetical protein
MSTRGAVLKAFKRCKGVDEALLVEHDSPLPSPDDQIARAALAVAQAAGVGALEHVHLAGDAATSIFFAPPGPRVMLRGAPGGLGAWRYTHERHRPILQHLAEVDA